MGGSRSQKKRSKKCSNRIWEIVKRCNKIWDFLKTKTNEIILERPLSDTPRRVLSYIIQDENRGAWNIQYMHFNTVKAQRPDWFILCLSVMRIGFRTDSQLFHRNFRSFRNRILFQFNSNLTYSNTRVWREREVSLRCRAISYVIYRTRSDLRFCDSKHNFDSKLGVIILIIHSGS